MNVCWHLASRTLDQCKVGLVIVCLHVCVKYVTSDIKFSLCLYLDTWNVLLRQTVMNEHTSFWKQNYFSSSLIAHHISGFNFFFFSFAEQYLGTEYFSSVGLKSEGVCFLWPCGCSLSSLLQIIRKIWL